MKITGEQFLEPVSRQVLEEVMRTAGVDSCEVTSGRRTPETQARIMYDNCMGGLGFDGSRTLYGAAGDEIIDLCELSYRSGEARQITIEAMADLIRKIGPERVSRHCSERFEVFDVAPSSINSARHDEFFAAARGHRRVFRVLHPPLDPSFHIEIKKEV